MSNIVAILFALCKYCSALLECKLNNCPILLGCNCSDATGGHMTRPSTIVRFAALAMMGTTLAIFPAAAQQMAANTGSGSTADFSRCDAMHASNPKGAITCRVEVLEAHTRQMQQESAEANQDIQCVDKIKAELAAGRITAEAVRQRLNGRKTSEVGACNLLGMLTRS